jgi:hypothetical protein
MPKQYDVVTFLKIPPLDETDFLKWNRRLPKAGDIGTIVEIYTDPHLGYEIECCETGSATPEWIHTFNEQELWFALGLAEPSN